MDCYKFNVAKYQKDAFSLSIAQEVAYRRLVDLYAYTETTICGTIDEIACSIRMHDYVDDVSFVLRRFFLPLSDVEWSIEWLDTQIARSRSTSKKRSLAKTLYWEEKNNAKKIAAPESKEIMLHLKNECDIRARNYYNNIYNIYNIIYIINNINNNFIKEEYIYNNSYIYDNIFSFCVTFSFWKLHKTGKTTIVVQLYENHDQSQRWKNVGINSKNPSIFEENPNIVDSCIDSQHTSVEQLYYNCSTSVEQLYPADAHEKNSSVTKKDIRITEENQQKEKTKRNRTPNRPEEIDENLWEEFKNLRNRKKAPITQRVIDGIANEAMKAGITLSEAISEVCTRGWSSFKAEWYCKKPFKQDHSVSYQHTVSGVLEI